MKSSHTEDRILKETGSMFFQHGIRSITMDDIAANLGISKKTIYIHYRDKKALVKSFTELELKNQAKAILDIRKESQDAVEEMIRMMIHLERFFSRVNPSVFYDLQKYHPESWQDFREFKLKVLIGFLEENLRNGIADGLYRNDLKVKVLARLRIEEVEFGFNPSFFPPDKFRIRDVQLALIDHFLHGIVTLKGFKLIDKYKKLNNKSTK